jgi:hypothetical protein
MVILGCYLQENSSDQNKATKIGSWCTSVQATPNQGEIIWTKAVPSSEQDNRS